MRYAIPIALGVLLVAACDARAQSTSSAASSSSSGSTGSSAAVTSRNGQTTVVTGDGRHCRVARGDGGTGTSSSVTTHADGTLSGSTRAGNTGVHVDSSNGRSSADCYVDERGRILEDRK